MLVRASSHASSPFQNQPLLNQNLHVTHIEQLSHCDTLGSTLVGLGVKMCMESVPLSNERSLLRIHTCILRQSAAQSIKLHGDGVPAAYRRSESDQFLYLVTHSWVHFTDPTPHPANPALGLYFPWAHDSPEGDAAVHKQVDSRDEGSCIGSQEQNGSSHLLRLGYAAQRMGGGQPCQQICLGNALRLGYAVVQLGVDHPCIFNITYPLCQGCHR